MIAIYLDGVHLEGGRHLEWNVAHLHQLLGEQPFATTGVPFTGNRQLITENSKLTLHTQISLPLVRFTLRTNRFMSSTIISSPASIGSWERAVQISPKTLT